MRDNEGGSEKDNEGQRKKPEWLVELESKVPPEWLLLLPKPGSGAILSDQLPREFPAETVAEAPNACPAEEMVEAETEQLHLWDLIGLYFRAHQRWHDAIAVYSSLYDHVLRFQIAGDRRAHKGRPLVWMAECYFNLGNMPLSKKYLMLTLVEDAITKHGTVDPTKTGSYFRLVWWHGLADMEFKRYAKESYDIASRDLAAARFPESVLQELDKNWVVEIPSQNDIGSYVANRIYIEYLLKKLGDKSGKALEGLADYVMSCIPACRTAMRQKSHSTDYDLVCSLEGPEVDFRSDFGRYFVCECKDWSKPADFTALAKFTRVLDSIKARFGIIFSKKGITGKGKTTNAEREQLKVFHDRGMVIVVIDYDDLVHISRGGNLVSLLRRKCEKVRLDLAGD